VQQREAVQTAIANLRIEKVKVEGERNEAELAQVVRLQPPPAIA
jgi:hypothetical protein